MTVDEKTKELVKRLRDERIQHSVMGPVSMREAADALEALAGEVESLKQAVAAEKDEQARMEFHHMHALADLAAERDRLKAALGAIAVKAGTSECGGNYVAAVSLIGDLEQMADAALRAAGDGR